MTICKKCKWYAWSNVLTDGYAICKELSVASRSTITGRIIYSHCQCINESGNCPHYEEKQPWYKRLRIWMNRVMLDVVANKQGV